MDYNIEYINLQYALINAFMLNINNNLLDISYNVEGDKLRFQIVLLEEAHLSEAVKEKVKGSLPEFDVTFNELHITKEKFNENRGEWNPEDYQWLDYLLFSKAEVL